MSKVREKQDKKNKTRKNENVRSPPLPIRAHQGAKRLSKTKMTTTTRMTTKRAQTQERAVVVMTRTYKESDTGNENEE